MRKIEFKLSEQFFQQLNQLKKNKSDFSGYKIKYYLNNENELVLQGFDLIEPAKIEFFTPYFIHCEMSSGKYYDPNIGKYVDYDPALYYNKSV